MIENRKNQTALVLNDKRISYEELLSEIGIYTRISENLPGKKVAIFAENSLEWIYIFYSSWYNGNINIPIDFMSTPSELAYIIDDSDVDVLFVSRKTNEVWKKASKLSQNQPLVYIIENIENNKPTVISEMPKYNQEDTALIIYTSGTTGSPKGVMLSYKNILVNIDAVSVGVPIYRENQEVLVVLPLHHILPLLGSIIAPLYIGGTCVMTPSLQSDDVMKTLADNKVNLIIGVPRFYSLIIKGIRAKINKSPIAKLLFNIASVVKSKSFSKLIFKKVHEGLGGHVEHLVCGGAAVDREIEKDINTLGFSFLVGFGMTESAPMITFPRPGNTRLGASGQSLPNSEIKIQSGEILVRGPQVMKGYYNKPKETAAVIKDGWLYTGDLGKIDKDGFLFITGRKKEIIVTESGKNINPNEIEFKLINTDEVISEIGVYYEDNILKAIIFPNFARIKSEGIINLNDYLRNNVIEKYNQTVSPYKRIRKFSIIQDELPKTRLGKIKRYELPKLAISDKKNKKIKIAEPDFPEYQMLTEYLSSEKGITISPNDHLELDLGLDSLDIVELQVFIYSCFGITLAPDVILEHSNIEKLAKYLKDKKTKLEIESVKWSEIFKEKFELKLPRTWFTHTTSKVLSRWLFSIYFRIKGEGTEKIPDGPVILAPNHQSFFDGLLVGMYMKNKLFKKTYFYAKKKHFNKKIKQFFAHRNNIILVDINKDLKESLLKMAEVLKNGNNLIIFPEGTRSQDGSLGDFKKTFAILSRELNVPVVPVAINGAQKALPKGKWFPRPFKEISVKFLDPIYPKGQNYDTLKENVRQAIANAFH